MSVRDFYLMCKTHKERQFLCSYNFTVSPKNEEDVYGLVDFAINHSGCEITIGDEEMSIENNGDVMKETPSWGIDEFATIHDNTRNDDPPVDVTNVPHPGPGKDQG